MLELLEDRLAPCVTPALTTLSHNAWRALRFSTDDITPAIDRPIAATEDDLAAQWIQGQQLIHLDQAFAGYGYRGQGYSVAVIDTGIDYTHPALGGGFGPGKRVVAGWDFVNRDADPMDDNGHGTHVAGIIGSSDANYSGIAPQVNLIALKVLDAGGAGSFGDVEDALRWVINNRYAYNIVAVNLSLGAGNHTSNPYTFLEDEFTSLRSQGVFIASASGNSFFTYNSQQGLGYPAVSPQVVSVGAVWAGNFGQVSWSSGAVDYTTAADRMASFTQRSSGLDIVAPGALLTSTYLGGGFQTMAGTSMATPVVAGAAVLLHQAFVAAGQSALATQDNILARMLSTAASVIDGDDENDNVVNTGLSFRRLDVFAALNSIGQPASLPFSDSFNRADSGLLGAGWNELIGDFAVSANRALPTTGFNVAALSGVSQADVTVQMDVAGLEVSEHAGLVARYGGAGDVNMYLGALYNSGGGPQASIWRNVGGNWTQLTVQNVAAGAGTLRFQVVGSSLRLFFNNTLVTYAYDTALTAGTVGIRTSGGVSVDNFSAAKVTLAQAPLPYVDNFTQANGFLSGNWRDRAGDFRVQSNLLQGNASLNVATLNTTSQANVSVQADVSVLGAGQHAGLVARYGGAGDANMYLGALSNVGTGLWASIWRNVNGVWTRLAAQTVAGASGTLRFSVAGSSLRLFLNNVQVATANDSALSTGAVGVRASVSATIDNFSAAVAVANSPPLLNAIPNQTMAANQNTLTINLAASDPDGDPLTFSAVTPSGTSLAHSLDQQYHLNYPGSYYTNTWGQNEKWLLSANNEWFMILPNGELRRWAGTLAATLGSASLIARLNAGYHSDPSLLWNAQPFQASSVTYQIVGNQLTITRAPSLVGSFTVQVTVSDGVSSVSRSFTVVAN